jgi:hypothetical protein
MIVGCLSCLSVDVMHRSKGKKVREDAPETIILTYPDTNNSAEWPPALHFGNMANYDKMPKTNLNVVQTVNLHPDVDPNVYY